MHLILITNDDGIDSPGLEALEVALSPLGSVVVVAPDRERSAASHAITIHQSVEYHQLSANRFAVEGTPADCVITALVRILDQPPALVVSGVNRGLNVGIDVLYSGTVAAASEAALQGVPAIAISARSDYKAAADVAARVARRALKSGLPPDIVLNVNFPDNWNGDVRLTRQGGRTPEPSTDCEAVASGYVSICPLQINRTAHDHLHLFADWTGPLRRSKTPQLR